jgi:hypothetical protein
MNSGTYGHNTEDWQFRNREYQGILLLRWNPMLNQKSLKTFSTAPDSDEAHAALAVIVLAVLKMSHIPLYCIE